MADAEKKYLDLAGLTAYDAKIKAYSDAKDAEINKALTAEIARADAAEKANAAAAKAAQDDVDALEVKVGDIPAGSKATTVVGYVDEKVEAINGAADTLAGRVTQAEKDIDAIEADYLKAADKKELKDAIDAADGKLTTLIGNDAGKSARAIANEELTKQLIPENANEALDTLQEIAQWIQDHPGEASEMNKEIKALQTLVGTLPANEPAYQNVVDFVQKLVAAEQERATGVEGGLNTRLTAAEKLLGDGDGSVADQIQKAVAAEAALREAADATLTKAVEKAQADVDAFARITEDEINALFPEA